VDQIGNFLIIICGQKVPIKTQENYTRLPMLYGSESSAVSADDKSKN